MIGYDSLAIHVLLHMQDLERESAMARLAARIDRRARPGYREHLARGLRAFARLVDPTCEGSVAHTATSVAH